MHFSIYRHTAVIFLLLIFFAGSAKAQSADTTIIVSQETADSLIALLSPEEYDSLMTELDDLFSFMTKRETSYVDISLTAGNANLTLKNIDAATNTYKTTNRLLLSPSAGYFHKSGFGAQVTAYFAPVKNVLKPYQGQASVFYDYLKGKKITAGISYSRVFTKDSVVDFYTSPFINNYNIYGAWKKGRLRPAVSVNYSDGSYPEGFVRPLGAVTYYKVLIEDISVTASLRYSFTKKNWLKKGDYLSFTPRAALICSGQKTEIINNNGDRLLSRLLTSGFIAARSVNSFEPQVMALYLSADYFMGSWYIHPQFYMDYYLHQSDRRSFNSFSITTGFMF
jgi:hypothetical protein